MLVTLGFLMVAVFMFLILTKRATPVVGLTLVPVAFGLLAGAGLGIGDMITDGIKSLAPHCGAVVLRDHLLRNHDRRRTLRSAGQAHPADGA